MVIRQAAKASKQGQESEQDLLGEEEVFCGHWTGNNANGSRLMDSQLLITKYLFILFPEQKRKAKKQRQFNIVSYGIFPSECLRGVAQGGV